MHRCFADFEGFCRSVRQLTGAAKTYLFVRGGYRICHHRYGSPEYVRSWWQ